VSEISIFAVNFHYRCLFSVLKAVEKFVWCTRTELSGYSVSMCVF